MVREVELATDKYLFIVGVRSPIHLHSSRSAKTTTATTRRMSRVPEVVREMEIATDKNHIMVVHTVVHYMGTQLAVHLSWPTTAATTVPKVVGEMELANDYTSHRLSP